MSDHLKNEIIQKYFDSMTEKPPSVDENVRPLKINGGAPGTSGAHSEVEGTPESPEAIVTEEESLVTGLPLTDWRGIDHLEDSRLDLPTVVFGKKRKLSSLSIESPGAKKKKSVEKEYVEKNAEGQNEGCGSRDNGFERFVILYH
jgi:hypothetical protein